MVLGFLKRVLGGGKVSSQKHALLEPTGHGQKPDIEDRLGFGGMIIGRRYQVMREFTDYDDYVHPVGECWTFKGSDYLPYEDGHTIWIEQYGEETSLFRLQGYSKEQHDIILNWHRYVREVSEYGED